MPRGRHCETPCAATKFPTARDGRSALAVRGLRGPEEQPPLYISDGEGRIAYIGYSHTNCAQCTHQLVRQREQGDAASPSPCEGFAARREHALPIILHQPCVRRVARCGFALMTQRFAAGIDASGTLFGHGPRSTSALPNSASQSVVELSGPSRRTKGVLRTNSDPSRSIR